MQAGRVYRTLALSIALMIGLVATHQNFGHLGGGVTASAATDTAVTGSYDHPGHSHDFGDTSNDDTVPQSLDHDHFTGVLVSPLPLPHVPATEQTANTASTLTPSPERREDRPPRP